jgi:hypothetical protein
MNNPMPTNQHYESALKIIEHPAFRSMKRMVIDCFGPFTDNTKIDELYIELRLLGMSEEDTKDFIMEALSNI